MASERRTTKTRGFSLGPEASEAIDNYADRNNMTKSMVVERAVLEYTKRERTARIEDKVDKILEQMDGGGAPTSGDASTHTQTQTQTVDEHESGDSISTPESDGGVAVADASAGVPQATFDTLEDYSPDYPSDYEISRDALLEAPQAVNDGLVINPDHVDYSVLRSKGTQVTVKTAVCAGIIRYNYSGGISEEQIKRTASEVLGGSRNARRHFDVITQYLCEHPTEHPLIEDKEIDESPKSLKKRVCAVDEMYAPSTEYVAEIYFPYDFSNTIDKLDKRLQGEPSLSSVAPCQGTLKSLHSKPAEYIEHACDSLSDYEETYRKYLRKAVAHQEEADLELEFPSPDLDSDELIYTVEEFNEIVE